MLGGVRAMQDGGVVGRPKSFQTAEAEGYPPNFTTPSAETRLEAFLHLIARNLPLGPLGKMLADKIRIQMVTTPGSMAAFVPSTYSVFNPPGAGYGYTAIDVRQAALDMAGGGSFLGAVNKLGWLLRHELTHAFVDFYHSLTETLDFAGLASSGIPGSVVRGPWGESSTQLERLKQLASSDPQHVPTQILDALPLTAGLRDLPEKLRSFFDGFLAYKQGGIVPGPLGKPQLGLLHGGEEVIPAGHRGEATVNNLQMHVTINGTSEEALTKFERLFNEMLRRAGYGGSSVSAGAFIPA
ncbi:MAG: hypothetical protein EHM35_01350 [Planctomycetaceae bacterium]|nr:MAG: hypothetical protein EHM35_01350 [Planctomycetaceae bacterium]